MIPLSLWVFFWVPLIPVCGQDVTVESAGVHCVFPGVVVIPPRDHSFTAKSEAASIASGSGCAVRFDFVPPGSHRVYDSNRHYGVFCTDREQNVLIYILRYPPIFSDGFESGTTSAWGVN